MLAIYLGFQFARIPLFYMGIVPERIVQTSWHGRPKKRLNGMIDFKLNTSDFRAKFELVVSNKLAVQLNGTLLDPLAGKAFISELEQTLTDSGARHVLFNLNMLVFINSEGLNALIRCLSLCRKKGADLWLTGGNEALNSLFISTRLNEIFTFIESQEAWMNLT